MNLEDDFLNEFSLPEKIGEKIEEKIKTLLNSNNPSEIKQGLLLCDAHGIASDQFHLYHKSDEEKNGNGFSNGVSNIKLEENKPEQKPAGTFSFHEEFPFKKRELYTLSEASLVNIISGCFSSYGSREIIRVFNTKEYLGKIAGITNLKRQQEYLAKVRESLTQNQKSTSEVFDEFVKYLDRLAYQDNKWTVQTEKFNKDKFSTKKNEQKERINHISYIEKARFIDSIFDKPIDYVSEHIYVHGKKAPYKELMKGTKTGYVPFLIMQLSIKWNNQDSVK
jgi:hypothetical protein